MVNTLPASFTMQKPHALRLTCELSIDAGVCMSQRGQHGESEASCSDMSFIVHVVVYRTTWLMMLWGIRTSLR